SGSHENGPDGFLLAYGASVARNRNLRRGSVVDLVPTMLYFMGLPIGRDMDGFARTDIFQPSFSEAHSITYIPTYGRGSRSAHAASISRLNRRSRRRRAAGREGLDAVAHALGRSRSAGHV